MKFLTPRLSAVHLEILHKMHNCVYLGNGARKSNFSENFDLQGVQCQLAMFAKNHFLAISGSHFCR